ncbi:MAG TPA: SCO family protein [Candidatus Cybelea sp.]|jgi:protein SCO1/2|nr:SCO family protein [Candidatus Cybelea sp.]
MIALFAAAAIALVPIHGVVLESAGAGSAIVRTDEIPQTKPAQIRRYALEPPIRLRSGTGIDAFLDESTQPPTLHDAVPAGVFAPGLPDAGRVVPIEIGSKLPAATLIDAQGRRIALNRAFAGKTLLLSFVFTRCPDRTLCPAISGKYAYLQNHLDPKDFALAEITLDPPYDSPRVLRSYASSYGAHGEIWTLLTGTGSTVTRLLDEFRISSMRLSTDNFLHDDKLFIVAPDGRVASVVQTASWDPDAVLAQARSIAGLASNPFERFRLALIANAVAICGGSEFAGIALLELTLFTFLTIVSFAGMWLVARVIWPSRT